MSDETDAGDGAATLGPAQLAELAPYGEEITVDVGDVLFSPADQTYDFWVVLQGEVEILRPDPTGDVLVIVHGEGRFLGELSLLTGQRPYLVARVSRPGRALRIRLPEFRRLMSEKAELADIIFRALMARREALRSGEGARAVKIIGSRFDGAALALRAFAGRAQLPHMWIDLEDDDDIDVLLASMGMRGTRHAGGGDPDRGAAPTHAGGVRPAPRADLPRAAGLHVRSGRGGQRSRRSRRRGVRRVGRD